MTPRAAPPLLHIRGLQVAFGATRIVEHIDLDLARGAALGIVGETAAQAFVRLNFLEELCRWQLLAMQTGRELQPVEPAVAAGVLARVEAGDGSYAVKQLAAMKRVLDKEEPDYRN